jgi:prepilin-type N-terminal cleavage/methylation domain-containing protein
MRVTSTRLTERRGFSLIELLVVIAIIGILVSLTASAIMPMIRKGPEMQTINDIRQLNASLDTFKNEYKTYPPSRIFLSNNPGDYSSAPPASIQAESLSYLQHIWPKIFDKDPRTGLPVPVDWKGAQGLLQGDQCLVFFLGGIQTADGPIGFSTNPRDPTALPTMPGETRKGPFFNFDSTRLTAPSTRKPPFNSTALVYLDVYGTPYAFFSSPKGANRYNALPLPTAAIGGDCPSLNVSPYAKNTGPLFQFYNPDTVQIISAGKDMQFGPGGTVPPGTPVQGVGADDFSNLTSGRHGAGM